LNLLAGLNLKGRNVQRHELSRSVGELAGSASADQQKDASGNVAMTAPTESIIVMAGLSDAKINALLAGIRQATGLKITLKAVLTEHNRSWAFIDLAAELRQEHAYMQIYMALQQVVRQAEQQLATATSSRQLQDVVKQAKKVLSDAQRGEADPKLMAALGREITGLLL
jgi:hypothetical protein